MRSDELWPIAVMAEQIAQHEVDDLLQHPPDIEPERCVRLVEAARALARHTPALVKMLEAVERQAMIPGWREQNQALLEPLIAVQRVLRPLPTVVGEAADCVGIFWIEGYWHPTGDGTFQYMYGRWEPSRTGQRWCGAHYEQRGAEYVFVEGCWIADQTPSDGAG